MHASVITVSCIQLLLYHICYLIYRIIHTGATVLIQVISYMLVLLKVLTHDMGYPQPPTTILCDNTSAIGLANDTIKQKRSKAIDMRFHWIRDRIRQN